MTIVPISNVCHAREASGRGGDIMVPMAIPTFGGMMIEFLTMFVVPVLYCGKQEIKLKLVVEDGYWDGSVL